ncbi:hypothetical protein P3T73_07355 [Kiritimatiellota bacterium B12222]|nr:hypothetical protein P3T73_07355 [Kiritimatiellota bacterium B12222]
MRKIDDSLKACWRNFKLGEFDQDTIRALFLTIREIAPINSLARDLGDAFAHTTRNRGIVFDQIGTLKETKETRKDGSGTYTFTFPMPQDAHSFCRGIAMAFSERKIAEKDEIISVIKKLSGDLIVCIFCLLQNSTIKFKNREEYELQISGSTSQNGANMPLLSLLAISKKNKSFIAFDSDVIFLDYFKESVSGLNLFAKRKNNQLTIEKI